MNRRDFALNAIGTATMLAAPALHAQNAAPAAARPRSNKGLIYKSTKTSHTISLETLAELKKLGFDGIEGGAPGIDDIAAYRKKAEDHGLPIHGTVCAGHWSERLSSPDAAIREKGRKNLEQALRDTRALGGSSVLLVPGKVSGPDETHDHVWERSITEIRKALPVASWEGIHILIETVWNGFCETPQLLADYIDEIDSPWVKVYYDIGNMQKFSPAHEWIPVLGSRIVKLDVKDWGVKPGFCPLGQGDVDWAKVREELAKIRFTGWCTREGSDGGHDKTAALMDELLDLR